MKPTSSTLALLAAAAATGCVTLLLPAEDGLSGGSKPPGSEGGSPIDAGGSVDEASAGDAAFEGCAPAQPGAVVHRCETFPAALVAPFWSYGLAEGGQVGVERAPGGGSSFALHATLPAGADDAYARIFHDFTGATFKKARLEFDLYRDVIEAENIAGITGLGSCMVFFGVKDVGVDKDFYVYVQDSAATTNGDDERRLSDPTVAEINGWRHVALVVDLERSVAEAFVGSRQVAVPLLAGCPKSVTSFSASVGFFFASGPSSVYFDNVSIQSE